MLTIAIQAGGESRRMGQDKGLMPFLGQPMVAYILQRVKSIADEVLVTTNQPHYYQFLNVPLYTDLVRGRGALGGLYTALDAASHPLVAVVACDMPFVNVELLRAEHQEMLATHADIVIPKTNQGMQPFHAIYRRETCLPFVQSAIEAGQWRVDVWFEHVRVHHFPEAQILAFDPQMLCFRNVNTPEELKAAEQLISQL